MLSIRLDPDLERRLRELAHRKKRDVRATDGSERRAYEDT